MIWKCKDKKLEYGKNVLIMGIVNVTPDSFSDGGDYFDSDFAVKHALELINDGADIIDIGAQSTRPGHTPVSDIEEWNRLKTVLNALKGKISVPVSIDTYYPYVAKKCLENGADIINDVSGEFNVDMARIVKDSGCGWVIMHNGAGKSNEVKAFFEKMLKKCDEFKIDSDRICLDMGIGFGKTYEESLDLIANVKSYKIDGYPLLLGTSRKRVIGRASRQNEPKERTYGNIAADAAAIFGGVDIVRIHDVKNEKQGIYTALELKNAVSDK